MEPSLSILTINIDNVLSGDYIESPCSVQMDIEKKSTEHVLHAYDPELNDGIVST